MRFKIYLNRLGVEFISDVEWRANTKIFRTRNVELEIFDCFGSKVFEEVQLYRGFRDESLRRNI